MKISQKADFTICLFVFCLFASSCQTEGIKPLETEGEIYSFQQPHMGTLFTIRVWAPLTATTETQLAVATSKAFERVAQLNQLCSDWLVESELNQLAQAPTNQPIPVSDELIDIFTQAEALSQSSDGAFDITVGPMVRLWRRCLRSQQLPSATQIEGAKARTGYQKLAIDTEAKTVTKSVDNMVLDLGGIAKGYAANQALQILRQAGFPNSIVAASGDIALGDPPPGKAGWSVGLETLEMSQPGERSLLLANRAVSTSGDTQRFLLIDGQRYSHIVDKQTGLGLTERIAVSVIAPDATTSDSYATAVSILGKEKGLQLIEATPMIECRIVTVGKDDQSQEYFSSGFPIE